MGERKRKSLVMQGTVRTTEHEPFQERYPWETTAQSPYDDRPLVGAPKVVGKGKLLRPDLRRLPAEYVTDEIHDPNAVHELDGEHIRDELALQRHEKETSDRPPDDDEAIKLPRARRVSNNQETVDLIILMTAKGRMDSAKGLREMGDPEWRQYLKHGHLWFPKDSTDELEWRNGNPPPDSERPKHLRGLDLVVDPMRINQRIVDFINESPWRQQRYGDAINEAVTAAQVQLAMMMGPEVLM